MQSGNVPAGRVPRLTCRRPGSLWVGSCPRFRATCAHVVGYLCLRSLLWSGRCRLPGLSIGEGLQRWGTVALFLTSFCSRWPVMAAEHLHKLQIVPLRFKKEYSPAHASMHAHTCIHVCAHIMHARSHQCQASALELLIALVRSKTSLLLFFLD